VPHDRKTRTCRFRRAQGAPPSPPPIPLRARLFAAGVDDLHQFFNDARLPVDRSAAPRTLRLAASLFSPTFVRQDDVPAEQRQTLPERVITDQLVREECDRDQNVYLGRCSLVS